MLEYPTALAAKLKKDERGSVMLLGGFSAIALCMMIGMAIDIGRAVSTKARVANAVDAAALAAAKGIRLENLTDSEAIALAKKVFDENMKHGSGNWTVVDDVAVTIDRVHSIAVVDAKTWVKTTFANVVGITRMDVPRSASALFESRDIEVGVQLDLTGSMCSPCQKLEDLKVATKDLVDILIPSTLTAQKVRVGFAPFSAGVNVGPYLASVNGNRASATNCVYERQDSNLAATDDMPDLVAGTGAYKIKEDLTGAVQNCPAAEIIPLSSNRTFLKDKVDLFQARSSTAGQLGAAWAWNLISPKWKDIWPLTSTPVPYFTPNTDKVVILMTDGVYNTIGGVNYGDSSAQATTASNLSIDVCNAMKEEGIAVYTVGFDLDSIGNSTARTRAIETLQACAGRKGTSHEGFFHKADDGLGLRAAFNSIATDIMRLRLTN